MFKKIFATVLILLLGCFQAYAATIVDTGPGPDQSSGWSLYYNQWLAGEFSLGQAETITDVYGWISSSGTGSLTLSLYADGGLVPDGSNRLYSTVFSVTEPTGGQNADWFGASGLNWDLSAGTYWVGFEARPGDTFSGAMPNPSSNPLFREAFNSNQNSVNYANYDGLDLGIRIYTDNDGAWLGKSGAEGTVAPEPASMILMGIGLAGAAMRRRKK